MPRPFAWALFRLGVAGGGRAIGLLSIWLAVQRLTDRLYRLETIQPGGVLLYSRRRYKGPPRALANGMWLRPGDLVLEIHANNRRIAPLLAATNAADTRRWTWTIYRAFQGDLDVLQRRIDAGGISPRPAALHAQTLLAAPLRRAGFVLQPLTGWQGALKAFFFRGLLVIYHPEGLRHWPWIARLEPVDAWRVIYPATPAHTSPLPG